MYSVDLDFTGERVVPGKTPDTIYREHMDRYVFAAAMSRDMVVLDVACGAGYGLARIMEAGAGRCVGVDVSLEAVAYSQRRYGRNGRTDFVCADGIRLPFADGSYDAVVSFETIEHLEYYEAFLLECGRVLRPGGLMICSTPNKGVFSPDVETPPNRFHVREFWPDEFRTLLLAVFREVDLYGQCDVTLADKSVERDRGIHDFRDDDEVSSAYVVAVARK